MTIKEARDILKTVTYKPGTEITVDSDVFGIGPARLTLRSNPVPDATGEHKHLAPTYSQRFIYLSTANRKDFLEEVFNVVKQNEDHERDEWLKIDGKHFNDPHPELRRAYGEKAKAT
jgi:hypothetical protein